MNSIKMSKRIIAILTVCALLFASIHVIAESADTEKLYDGKVPHTVSIQLKNEDMSTAALSKAKASGVGFVRKGIYWNSIETTKGTYDWSKTDAWVNDMEKNGFGMMLTVVWNNRLYEDIWDRAIVTEEGRKAFAKFAADLVTHYQGKDIIYEIWNEPNLRGFWHENDTNKSNTNEMADEYTALVKEVVPTMKAADPNCRVAVGSISALWSDSFSWFRQCVKSGITESGADYISVHPYGFSFPELAMQDGYPEIRKMLDENGGENIGIINSEVGYDEGWLVERGMATKETVEEVQAWCFVRQNVIDHMSNVQLTNWYEFSDSELWGMVNDDLSERPTFTASKVLTTELKDYKYLYTLPMESKDDYIAVYGNDEGAKKLVAWTAPNAGTPTDKRGTVESQVSIPVGKTGSHKVTDIFGKTSTATSKDGVLEMKLTGSPVYIDNVDPAEPAAQPTATPAPTPTAKPAATPIPTANPAEEITVKLNGTPIVFDVKPQQINDRIMVPIRAIFEAMGAEVTWDDATETATAVKGDKTVKMTINKKEMTINGTTRLMDVSPLLLDDRTLAPARFVAEAFGGKVEWDEDTLTASITL